LHPPLVPPSVSFNALSTLSAHAFAAEAIKAAMEREKISVGDVTEVVLGQIWARQQGQAPHVRLRLPLYPREKTAYSLNQLCGSGLRAVCESAMMPSRRKAAYLLLAAWKA